MTFSPNYVKKKIPCNSSFGAYSITTDLSNDFITITDYNGSNATVKISFYGETGLELNTSNSAIKLAKPETQTKQNTNNSDKYTMRLINLKRLDESIQLVVYLEDDANFTAWQKYWMLRAMSVAGNIGNDGSPLKEAYIGGITFNTSTMPLVLEKLSGSVPVQDYNIQDKVGLGEHARMRVTLTLVFGAEKT